MPRGRLLKKAEQEKFESLQVEKYPWQDLTPDSILLPDNPRKSVVLAKTHSGQELKKKVHKAADFSRTFGQPSKPLFPQDMTAEFLASQEELRQRKLRMQMDEDELVALELSDLNDEEQLEQQSEENEEAQKAGVKIESMRSENAGAAASAPAQSRMASPDISDLSSLTPNKNKGLGGRGLDFGLNEITQEKLDAEVKAAFERGVAQGRNDGEQAGYERGVRDVSPTEAQSAEVEDQNPVDPEVAERRYSEGLEAGIEQGRLQAAQEAEQKYNHSMELFTKALSELQHLKGELLSTGREIFAEIAQMCAEKVLRHHVQWNDEALRRVFTAAMSQFQSQDELKIEMHPEDVARLERQIPEDQRTRLRLVSNSKLQRGDIKIEANNEVVSFDIQKTVNTVIDSLKDELFDDVKKEESDEKAG